MAQEGRQSQFYVRTVCNLCMLVTVALYSISMSANVAYSQTASPLEFVWDPPTQNVDGSPLTDLAGYTVFSKAANGTFTALADVTGATYTRSFTQAGRSTYVVQAFDTAQPRNTSPNSNELTVIALSPQMEVGSASGRIFELELRAPGGTTILQPVLLRSVNALAFAGFNPASVNVPNTVDLRLRAPGFLWKRVPNWDTSSSTALPMLLGGDFDGNNTVGATDIQALIQGWGRPGVTDLDKSGSTGALDVNVLVRNYRRTGD